MTRPKYKGWSPPPIMGGTCPKHDRKVGWTRVCLDCHHEALEDAGVDWRAIGGASLMGGGGQRQRDGGYSKAAKADRKKTA